MKATEEQVIEYLSKLNYRERKDIDIAVSQRIREKDHKKYIIEKARRKTVKENQIIEGEKFKHILVPGMLVKMRGTKDGTGLREVLEFDETGVLCRKVKQIGFNKFKRDGYITTHMWDKVVKVIHEDIDEFMLMPNTKLIK